MTLLHTINEWIITPALPVCLMAAGLWFCFALRFPRLCSPRLLFSVVSRQANGSGVSPAAAMSVALAGTLGVGNIVGVASALSLGGPGAIFWMWVSALLAMVLKYAEITLALGHRRRTATGELRGGAMYYIEDCVSSGWLGARGGRILGSIFALLCLANALTMGSVIQVRAVSSSFSEVAQIPPIAVGIGMVLLVSVTLCRGIGGIARVTERLIPLASAAFLFVSALALFRLRDGIGCAFASILSEAFTPQSAAGGVSGFLLSRALRYGTMRGLLSNEAGCGTAPTAHAESNASCPAEQGIWGIIEVFVDTILLCTVTALVILASGVELAAEDGMLLVLSAYRTALGDSAGWFLCGAILIFAFATILCWAHYGTSAVRWFGEVRGKRVAFLTVYAASILLGAIAAPALIWEAADFALGTMTLINLLILCIMMPEIKKETEEFLRTQKKPKKKKPLRTR